VNCPADFREEAKRLLKHMPNCGATATNKELRDALLEFIGDFADWDSSAKPAYLECSRGLVKAAHGEEPPLVVDPFAGGGSIPLEALRIGCDAFASDLNPVACLILKVLLEDIPRQGPGLPDELRRVGRQIKEQAEKELAEFYPPDPGGARPIAYLWARTVRCESPHCGAEVPLARSFWLSKNAKRRRALRLHVRRTLGSVPTVELQIIEPTSDADVHGATVKGAKGLCPACNAVMPSERVRAQLREQRGGADVVFDMNGRRVGGARLLAVATLQGGDQGRRFRLPSDRDYHVVRQAREALGAISTKLHAAKLNPVPDEALPPPGTLGFRVQPYGMTRWGDLFTARQKLFLLTIIDGVRNTFGVSAHGATQRLVGLVVSKLTNLLNAGAPWKIDRECPVSFIAGQRLPPVWDWCEAVPLSGSSGSLASSVERVAEAVESSYVTHPGTARLADAAATGLPDASSCVFFTDPPYYNAVAYGDLSDFYYVWLKRLLTEDALGRDSFDPANTLTPKRLEAVQDESKTVDGKPKDRTFFESRMASAFAEGRRILTQDGIGCIVFAHKTTEGWEALLTGLVGAGWVITGSWPIATEMQSRLRARASAALATSVHLVCRPRPENAGIAGWEDILRELPHRIGDWMERLSGEGIRGADLVFSCIGPALELFSKYDNVETAEGREVKLPEFLEKVWEVVGRTALQQILGTAEARARNSTAGALEEDARLTALFLWTLQSTNGTVESQKSKVQSEGEEEEVQEEEEEGTGKSKKGYVLIYDVARRFAQPLGIHLENWEGRIIETKKGVVRLIPVVERAEQLFGEAGTEAVARAIERTHGESPQFTLFPDHERAPETPIKTRKAGRGRKADTAGAGQRPSAAPREATTLDRVHAAMLLQAGGQATALRAMLEAETQRSPDFLRLANALSALYPKDSEEKRLLDAMLLSAAR
jgi:adenine-specific DNA methylase